MLALRTLCLSATKTVLIDMLPSEPLVSIITPVYNGAKYLAKCMSSVLSQRYSNWEYIVVNNCSNDTTLDIALGYETKDSRVRVVTNSHFAEVIDNHNIAFRQISPQSKYCKLVSADDWLYPEAIQSLVTLADCNPSLGILQGYVVTTSGVRSTGITVDANTFSGREIGRQYLLGQIDITAPSSLLYRSSIVRSMDPFFPGKNASADVEACLRCLQYCDFGVVPQIVSYERIHEEAVTARVRKLHSYLLDRIELVLQYGKVYLTRREMDTRLEQMLVNYYEVIAAALVNGKGREFRRYHQERLRQLGLRFYGGRLGRALSAKVLDLLLNPKQTVEKGLQRVFKPGLYIESMNESSTERQGLQVSK
jgi:glycosyltransferase involved in cell wall biosynthesis